MELKKKSENVYVLEKKGKMNVPVVVYASDKLIDAIKQDKTLEQAKNVAMLPGIVKGSFIMPDAHQGYGFSIGGVAAFAFEDGEGGVVSPGGVGYDINCGVRLVKTNISLKDFMKKRKEVLHDIFRTVPSGVGRGHKEKITDEILDSVLVDGAKWAIDNGYGVEDDLNNCEEGGKMENANPKDVSQKARARGKPQLGTLGAGNHFLEILKVDEIFNDKLADEWGIDKDNVVVMIHCGSRGLGHQVASDYIRLMEKEIGLEGIKELPDRELINAPLKSDMGKKYLSAMACAVNFAFCNRQMIMHSVRNVLKRHFKNFKGDLVYDVAHNIAKFEEHFVDVDGNKEKMKLCVHRKGATRAFDKQPVILPGSMGTASYLLVGTKEAEELSFGSTAHGAGRVMSRSKAIRDLDSSKIKKELEEKDIVVEAGSNKGIAEEAPQVYKDIEEVAKVSDELGIAKKVIRFKPLAVMKG